MQSQDDPTPRLTAPWGAPEPSGNALSRRSAFKLAMSAAGLAAAGTAAPSAQAAPDPRKAAPKRYGMKKSINLWAFPYPDRMNLRECLQLAKDAGFDGIELNYDLESDLSPKAGPRDFRKSGRWPTTSASPSAGCARFCFGRTR